MKRKTLIACVLAVTIAGSSNSFASDYWPGGDPGAIAVDTLLVRPVCFVATIFGSALFVVSLPVAATSKSIKRAAHALVVTPAQATFTRPLGEFSEMSASGD